MKVINKTVETEMKKVLKKYFYYLIQEDQDLVLSAWMKPVGGTWQHVVIKGDVVEVTPFIPLSYVKIDFTLNDEGR